MKTLKPELIPHLLPVQRWLSGDLAAHSVDLESAWVILFDGGGNPKNVLTGDDARLFAWSVRQLPELRVSPHVFYDPYDMPEWFYLSWHDLDMFALLVQHEVIDASEWEPGELPRRWGRKF